MISPTRSEPSRPCGCGGTAHASSSPSGCGCGCGAGECHDGAYVRPLFFPGQLLTEEDLQSLGDYVAAKNRLHNRHLFGQGVVCGFEVTCQPCGGGKVVVHPGYALDGCGNDLVLGCARTLDVNALVRELRQRSLGGYDCGDPCAERAVSAPVAVGVQNPGGDVQEAAPAQRPGSRHYCLYARYCEERTDPVSPYATDEPCAVAGCEPTRLREGLRFELRCKEERRPPAPFAARFRDRLGDAAQLEKIGLAALNLYRTASPRLLAIQKGEAASTATIPGDDQDRRLFGQGFDKAACDLREDLLRWLDRSPELADCALRREVQSIDVCRAAAEKPAIEDPVYLEAVVRLAGISLRPLQDGLCRAVLPPCPTFDDSGVLLACLEVRDCEVVGVCNLERTFVPTAPALRYWLPLDRYEQELEARCCERPAPRLTAFEPAELKGDDFQNIHLREFLPGSPERDRPHLQAAFDAFHAVAAALRLPISLPRFPFPGEASAAPRLMSTGTQSASPVEEAAKIPPAAPAAALDPAELARAVAPHLDLAEFRELADVQKGSATALAGAQRALSDLKRDLKKMATQNAALEKRLKALETRRKG